MRKAKLQAATLGGNPDDIEAAFYDALRQGDIERLMACWADEEEIVCVHPGGPRLIGSGAIRATFEAMFANGTVQAHPTNVHKVDSLASAMHHLVERVEVLGSDGPQTAYVLTTNVYHKTPQGQHFGHAGLKQMRRIGDVRGGPRQTMTLWMWIFVKRHHLIRSDRCWCSFMAWKALLVATIRKPLPNGVCKMRATLPYRTSEGAVVL